MKKMKKTVSILAIFSLLNLNTTNLVAQDVNDTSVTIEMTTDSTVIDSMSLDSITSDSAILVEQIAPELIEEVKEASFHQIIKQKFIEGGPGFMGIVLL